MKKTCKICDRLVPSIEDEFCCAGCSAVFSIIEKLNLEGSERDERIKMLLEGVFPGGTDVDVCSEDIENPEKENFRIEGMVCPACAWLIHNRLVKTIGISEVNINFISEICELKYNPMKVGFDDLKEIIESLGYLVTKNSNNLKNIDLFRFGAGWFMALNCMMISFVVYSSDEWNIPLMMKYLCSFLLFVFGTLVPFYAAKKTFQMGISQLSQRSFRMESLVVLSTFSAWLYSIISLCIGDFGKLYFDVVALLLMLIETGNLITYSFYRKLYNRVNSLSLNLPKKVRIHDDEFLDFQHIEPGAQFEVIQNEIVPIDGILLDDSEFDFSLISGESIGIHAKKGHFIGAGSKLLSSKAKLIIPPHGKTNLMENIVNNTIEAFNSKKDQFTLGDKISQLFVPIVVSIAICILFLNIFNGNIEKGFYSFLSILIVACPCAFGIAEPLVLTFGIDKMRKIGIQCHNGLILSLKPDRIIFDKTGTLTNGKPNIVGIKWLVNEDPRLFDILGSMEYGINHPIAKACSSLGKKIQIFNREIFNDHVSATIDDKKYIAGGINTFPNIKIPEEFKDNTIVLFGDDKNCFLIIALNDTIRKESFSVLNSLKKLKIKMTILSGDRNEVVKSVGSKLDIKNSFGEMSSEDKKNKIKQMQDAGEVIMMIGDGINDSQALAISDIGLSVYSAESSAKMSSDSVFLQPGINSLKKMPDIINKVRSKIKMNYSWAFLYNIIGIILASFGLLSPKFCAVGMVFSNLVVLFNSSIWKEK